MKLSVVLVNSVLDVEIENKEIEIKRKQFKKKIKKNKSLIQKNNELSKKNEELENEIKTKIEKLNELQQKIKKHKLILPILPKKPVLIGLNNIGATCFMNSTLQCLSQTKELTKYFLLDLYEDEINIDNKLGTGGEIASIYRELLDDLWNGEKSIINPSYFKKVFSLFVRKFSGYHQQDSNEFLIYLLKN